MYRPCYRAPFYLLSVHRVFRSIRGMKAGCCAGPPMQAASAPCITVHIYPPSFKGAGMVIDSFLKSARGSAPWGAYCDRPSISQESERGADVGVGRVVVVGIAVVVDIREVRRAVGRLQPPVAAITADNQGIGITSGSFEVLSSFSIREVGRAPVVAGVRSAPRGRE